MGRRKKEQQHAQTPAEPGARKRRARPIPLWQWGLLALSAVLMLAGGAAWAYSAATRERHPPPPAASAEPAGGSSLTDGLVSDFLPGGPPIARPGGAAEPEPGAEATERRAIDTYSPAVFRLGFSFFAGFAMAYAVRQFVKATLLVAGVILLGMFGLQYAGLVQINWSVIEGRYDSIAAFLRDQTASFTAFVSGYLPSATSAAAGAFVGFRRK